MLLEKSWFILLMYFFKKKNKKKFIVFVLDYYIWSYQYLKKYVKLIKFNIDKTIKSSSLVSRKIFLEIIFLFFFFAIFLIIFIFIWILCLYGLYEQGNFGNKRPLRSESPFMLFYSSKAFGTCSWDNIIHLLSYLNLKVITRVDSQIGLYGLSLNP